MKYRFLLPVLFLFVCADVAAQPYLYTPSNGATDVSIPVHFIWSSESGAIQYQLQVDDASGFSSPVVDINTTNTDYSAAGLTISTTYYWRVRSYYPYAPFISDWSSVSTFTTECPTPGRPQLVYPSDNSNIEIIAPVTFDWNPISGAVNYQIQVDNNSGFTSPHVDQTTTSTYFTVSDFVYDYSNYWRVRADYGNGCGWGSWSSVWDFMPTCGVPVPGLLSPGNNVIITEDVSEVKMDWNTVASAEYYHLIVWKHILGPAYVYFDDTVSTSHFYLTVENLEDYYWQVGSNNEMCLEEEWSDIWHYTVCHWPPPTALVPEDGATDVDIYPLYFEWQHEESAGLYNLHVDDNPDFSSPLIDITTAASSYSSSTNNADYSTTYYWRVNAYTSHECAGWSGWSVTRSFTTECIDYDEDNICFDTDNCPWEYNPDQVDSDGDGFGNECDKCPGYDDNVDTDEDTVPNGCDNCPTLSNEDQADNDLDGEGDVCDTDDDNDGIIDEADNCPFTSNSGQEDGDLDDIGNVCDNCPIDYNPDQLDLDGDGNGYVCDDNVIAGAIILDDIDGLHSGDTVLAGSPVRFTFRLIYHPGDGSTVTGFQNYFRLWTHRNGALSDAFSPITYDTLPVNWLAMFDLGIFTNPHGVDGLGEDTVSFGGLSLMGGLPDNFSQPVWWIETTPLNPGDTLCIDRHNVFDLDDHWWWNSTGIWNYFNPQWPGPYCFVVVDPDLAYVCGDANGDNNVNVGDAVFLINYVFKGGPAPDPIEAGDANCDGDSNVGDAVYLIAYVFNSGPAPCCP